MADPQANNIDFSVNKKNLFKEEANTDMKVASIRVMTPVLEDGTEDSSRTKVFIGSTQLMSPDGPLPLQAVIPANNFSEAMEKFPETMEKTMGQMIEQIKQMQDQKKQKDDSRIIVPGR